jgi:hypothetical protein
MQQLSRFTSLKRNYKVRGMVCKKIKAFELSLTQYNLFKKNVKYALYIFAPSIQQIPSMITQKLTQTN